MIWDRALGYQYIPLETIQYNYDEPNPNSYGKWYSIDTDLILMDGEVAGTRDPTGHMILLDLRFEMPFGNEPF
jgi:protein unc-13